MPAQRPCASFDPIPPDIDLPALVEATPNFEYVVRIPFEMIEHQGLEAFEKLILLHVIIGGKPLVIEGFHHRLDQWTFTTQWLHDNVGKKFEQARNLTKRENIPLSINHYLSNMQMLADQWNPYNYKESHRQRLYLKDIDCPQVWHDKLREKIPPGVFYLNESTGDMGGPGSMEEPNPNGLGMRQGYGAARAGDLMSCLPSAMRAENLMCYIGHEGTYTPAHREMCASLGQNIMVEASKDGWEDGKPTKIGSSIWFMTETSDRHLVSEYWLSALGHDVEVEAHFAQINAWKAAPFTTYIVEQKVGDFLLIPPLAPHQVWNRGTRTMKIAWNRTTVETLEMAINEALPRARLVCRDEQYKNKAIVLFALQKYSGILKQVVRQKKGTVDQQKLLELTYSPKIRQVQKDFRRLFALYTQILLSEMFSAVAPAERRVQYLAYDSNVTCSYCRCNIFNRFLTCTSCVILLENGEEDTYDICMECYAMGRSCHCLSKLKWVEQFPWQDLLEKYDIWRCQIAEFEGGRGKPPQTLDAEREQCAKRTLAEICQEQLRLRPWHDPKKETLRQAEEEGVEEDQVNEDGSIKKRRKKTRSEKWLRESVTCHICRTRTPSWKHAICGCGLAFCYGSLWRAFDMMPQSVMENSDWKCPRCLKICSCQFCRRDPESKPFEPNGTILGHDTRKIADPRSVESLVDFSHSNMHWVKKAGDDNPHDTRRLRRRQNEAAEAKERNSALDEYYVDDENDKSLTSPTSSINETTPIDPMLDPQLNITSSTRHVNGQEDIALSTKNEHQRTEPTNSQPMRQAAMNALNAMNGLSQLEQDPHRFMAEAGIANLGLDGQEDSGRFIAPAATMLDSNLNGSTIKVAANGVQYDYPDPTSLLDNMPNQKYPQQSLPVNHSETPHISQKANRQSGRPTAYTELLTVPNLGSLKKESRPIPWQVAAKARKNDCFISTQAALSNKHLLVKIPLEKSKLAALQSSYLATRGPLVGEKNTVTVSSDLHTASEVIGAPKQSTRPKRRLNQDEKDGDFTTGRSGGRPKSFTHASGREQSISSTHVNTDDSGSGEDFFVDSVAPLISKATSSNPRPLPSYLARRSPASSSEVPRELADKEARQSYRKNQHDQRRCVTSPEERNDNAVTATGDDAVIDPFAGEPVPEPKTDFELYTLGPGANDFPHYDSKTTMSTISDGLEDLPEAPTRDVDRNQSSTAEANRKVKLRAMKLASGKTSTSQSESSSMESSVERMDPKRREPQVQSKGKQRISISGGKLVQKDSVGLAAKSPRNSIFSRLGNLKKKIRISAAKIDKVRGVRSASNGRSLGS